MKLNFTHPLQTSRLIKVDQIKLDEKSVVKLRHCRNIKHFFDKLKYVIKNLDMKSINRQSLRTRKCILCS